MCHGARGNPLYEFLLDTYKLFVPSTNICDPECVSTSVLGQLCLNEFSWPPLYRPSSLKVSPGWVARTAIQSLFSAARTAIGILLAASNCKQISLRTREYAKTISVYSLCFVHLCRSLDMTMNLRHLSCTKYHLVLAMPTPTLSGVTLDRISPNRY